MKNKEDMKYFYQLLSCLQQVVKKLQQQQQQNTFKYSSDAVTVSLNKELSQLSTKITPWSKQLIFG